MSNPVHPVVSPFAELLSGFNEADVKKMAEIIESAESGPEPDNTGITSLQFLEAAKAAVDKYKNT